MPDNSTVDRLKGTVPFYILRADDPLAPPLLQILAGAYAGEWAAAMMGLFNIMSRAQINDFWRSKTQVLQQKKGSELTRIADEFDDWHHDHKQDTDENRDE